MLFPIFLLIPLLLFPISIRSLHISVVLHLFYFLYFAFPSPLYSYLRAFSLFIYPSLFPLSPFTNLSISLSFLFPTHPIFFPLFPSLFRISSNISFFFFTSLFYSFLSLFRSISTYHNQIYLSCSTTKASRY